MLDSFAHDMYTDAGPPVARIFRSEAETCDRRFSRHGGSLAYGEMATPIIFGRSPRHHQTYKALTNAIAVSMYIHNHISNLKAFCFEEK